MAILSDQISFSDAIISRSALVTFTSAGSYKWIPDELFNDGTNKYILYLSVKDNKNSKEWMRAYQWLDPNASRNGSWGEVFPWFTVGDTPVIDITTNANSITLLANPSPSTVIVEVRVENIKANVNTLVIT